MVQLIPLTEGDRLGTGAAIVVSDASEALFKEGRMLAYSARGTLTNSRETIDTEMTPGIVTGQERLVTKTVISINGRPPIIRQVDAGRDRIAESDRLGGYTVHQSIRIMDADDHLIKEKKISLKISNGDDKVSGTSWTRHTRLGFTSKAVMECTKPKTVANGEAIYCTGTIYDGEQKKIGKLKSSSLTDPGGLAEISDYEYHDKYNKFLGTVHSEIHRSRNQKTATIDVTITNGKAQADPGVPDAIIEMGKGIVRPFKS